jgi:hypothetical protein
MRAVPIDDGEFKITVDRRLRYIFSHLIGRLTLLTK